MINELVVATHNQGKVEEFKVLMKDLPIEIKYLADFDAVEAPAETGRTFAANARQKATYYAKKLGKPCIADDSGLEVLALDGAPGVRSARYAGEKASDEDNNNLLLHNMKFQVKRTCRFRCALCVAQPDGKVLNEVDGICDGTASFITTVRTAAALSLSVADSGIASGTDSPSFGARANVIETCVPAGTFAFFLGLVESIVPAGIAADGSSV